MPLLFAQPFLQAQIKEESKLRVASLIEGNPPVTDGLASQRDSNAETISIYWHHDIFIYLCGIRVEKPSYYTTCLRGWRQALTKMNTTRNVIRLLLVFIKPISNYWKLGDWRRFYTICFELHILILNHWGKATHICVSKLIIIGSNNGFTAERRQAIIWTNAGILLIRTLGRDFSEILSTIQTFLFNKMRLKWRQFCHGLYVLRLLLAITFLLLSSEWHCSIVINTLLPNNTIWR